MLRARTRLAALGLAAGLAAAWTARAAPDAGDSASQVVVVANASDPESVDLARYYAARRGIPPANLVALPMPAAETIGWPEFIRSVYQPLQDELLARGWLEGFTTSLTDRIGRKRHGISGHHIRFLVVCRGVPLRVAADRALAAAGGRQDGEHTNAGAVDSELAMLAHDTYEIDGWLPNPLFRADQADPVAFQPVVRVARLDGPSAADARALVDHALEGERTGLIGRFYVDLRGPHPDGERWLGAAAEELAGLGFDGDVNRAGGLAPVGARFDAPAWYFGWHSQEFGGPMGVPGFRFPPGAIALHIHSYSAHTLRSAASGWCGPLVSRGVTATFGNVFEPYLQLTIEPNLLLAALIDGKALGDAAYYAEPALSWQTVIIGDPLYRPLAASLQDQIAHLDTLPASLVPYAVLRQANLMERAGRKAEARQWLQRNLASRPGVELALALARRLNAAGDRLAAVRALESVPHPGVYPLDQIPAARQAADLLASWGAARTAVALFDAILANDGTGGSWRAGLLREAHAAAVAAGDRDRASRWEPNPEAGSP